MEEKGRLDVVVIGERDEGGEFETIFYLAAFEIEGEARVANAIEGSREYLMSETLAVRWELPTGPHIYSIEHEEGELRWRISLKKA